jgi:hypothetical protein
MDYAADPHPDPVPRAGEGAPRCALLDHWIQKIDTLRAGEGAPGDELFCHSIQRIDSHSGEGEILATSVSTAQQPTLSSRRLAHRAVCN